MLPFISNPMAAAKAFMLWPRVKTSFRSTGKGAHGSTRREPGLLGRLQKAEDVFRQLIGLRGHGRLRLAPHGLNQRIHDLRGLGPILNLRIAFLEGRRPLGQALQHRI